MSKIKCKNCGERVDSEESYGAEVGPNGKWGDVCSDCYHEIIEQCQECGEDTMPSDMSDFVVFKWELSQTGPRPPGVYRVLSRPFLLCPMIGSTSIFAYDVLFVDKLPKRDNDYEISGKLCRKCAKPHEETMRRVYWPARGAKFRWERFDKEYWWMERQRTRDVILSNPQMIRDLECEDCEHGRWAEMRKFYGLPEMRTYNDWLYVEHKGVKVYSINPGHEFGWFALRPEPEYRDTWRGHDHKLIFAASGLPTWPKRDDGDMRYSWQRSDLAKPAIIKAIDRRILTQDGVVKNGKVVFCG